MDHRDCPLRRFDAGLFLGGADFNPPPPRGAADRTRYVMVTTLDEGKRPELLDWTEQAGRTPGETRSRLLIGGIPGNATGE